MARPVGDDSPKPPTAISRPEGGWFARIWNQRSPAGQRPPGSQPDQIRLGRSEPFTLWVSPDAVATPAEDTTSAGISALPAISDEGEDAKPISMPGKPFTLWTGADPNPVPASASAEEMRPANSSAFTIWTGADAPSASPDLVSAAAGAEQKRPANSSAFTIWSGAEALATGAGKAAASAVAPALHPANSSAFSVWIPNGDLTVAVTTPKAEKPTPVSSAETAEEAAAPVRVETSRAFTLWSDDSAAATPDVASAAALDSSDSKPRAVASADIAPIPLGDSRAFTLWAGAPEGVAAAATPPTTSSTMNDPSSSSAAAGAISLPGGSKAFSIWAPATDVAATAPAAPPAKEEPKWERAADQQHAENPNILPLIAAAIALLALLIALFIIADRNKEVRRLEGEVGTLTTDNKALARLGAKKDTALQGVRANLASTTGNLTAAKAQVTGLETKVSGLESTLGDTQKKLASTEKERDELAAAKTAAEKQVGSLKTALDEAKTASAAAAKVAAEKLASAEAAAASTGEKLVASEKQIGELGERISTLGAKIQELKAKITDLGADGSEAAPQADEKPEPPKKDDGPSQV